MQQRNLEVVVLSDVHLGTYGCHAKELLQYLKSIRTETLILNGDFIDGWQFKKKYFPKEHLEVINQIIKVSVNGTKVYYITGNHDDMLRKFSDISAGSIHLRDKLVLQLGNKKYWVFHGDIFDASVMGAPFLAKLGGQGYDWLIRMNRLVNLFRSRFNMPPYSFAGVVKSSVKRAVKFIQDFENLAINVAAEKGFDAVICGHIHMPQSRIVQTTHGTVHYLNSGDWVENLSALEYRFGEWTIYSYDEADYNMLSSKLQVKEDAKPSPSVPRKTTQEVLYEKIVINTKGYL